MKACLLVIVLASLATIPWSTADHDHGIRNGRRSVKGRTIYRLRWQRPSFFVHYYVVQYRNLTTFSTATRGDSLHFQTVQRRLPTSVRGVNLHLPTGTYEFRVLGRVTGNWRYQYRLVPSIVVGRQPVRMPPTRDPIRTATYRATDNYPTTVPRRTPPCQAPTFQRRPGFREGLLQWRATFPARYYFVQYRRLSGSADCFYSRRFQTIQRRIDGSVRNVSIFLPNATFHIRLFGRPNLPFLPSILVGQISTKNMRFADETERTSDQPSTITSETRITEPTRPATRPPVSRAPTTQPQTTTALQRPSLERTPGFRRLTLRWRRRLFIIYYIAQYRRLYESRYQTIQGRISGRASRATIYLPNGTYHIRIVGRPILPFFPPIQVAYVLTGPLPRPTFTLRPTDQSLSTAPRKPVEPTTVALVNTPGSQEAVLTTGGTPGFHSPSTAPPTPTVPETQPADRSPSTTRRTQVTVEQEKREPCYPLKWTTEIPFSTYSIQYRRLSAPSQTIFSVYVEDIPGNTNTFCVPLPPATYEFIVKGKLNIPGVPAETLTILRETLTQDDIKPS